VLEIGAGSGYQAAILSKLCRDVVTLERFRTLADRARLVLKEIGCNNVDVVLGDGFDVPDTLGTFDRIIVTAAMQDIPQALLGRLEPNGILIAPVGPMNDTQVLTRLTRKGDGFARQELVAVRFVPALQGIAREL
jgi:protein-L-isoaspartate(D-aspartate) O-methyltransferase